MYNCAVSGYNLGQYLLRIRKLEATLDPDIIIVGFSMATDLYDLIPPRLGGFVYGSEYGRIYFDLDNDGNLIEKNELKGKRLKQAAAEEDKSALGCIKRHLRKHSALYRHFKRSETVLYLAGKFLKIEEMWPGSVAAVKKDLNTQDLYRWNLAEKILKQIVSEAALAGRTVIVVNIPYIPQVYDGVWNASFGQHPDLYDRFIGAKRLGEICKQIGAYYIDCTPRFIEEVNLKKIVFIYCVTDI